MSKPRKTDAITTTRGRSTAITPAPPPVPSSSPRPDSSAPSLRPLLLMLLLTALAAAWMAYANYNHTWPFAAQSGPQKKRCVRSNPLAPDTNEFCDSAPSLTAVAQAPPRYGPLQVPIYLVGAHDGSAGARAVGYSIRAPNRRRTGASAAPVEASAEKSEFGT